MVRVAEQSSLVLLATAVGVGAGALMVGYYHLVRALRFLFTGEPGLATLRGKAVLALPHSAYVIPAAVVGGLLIGILNHYFTPDARSSFGIPGVIEAIALRGGWIRPRVVAARAMTAALCIGCGGAAGKQAAIAQMGLVLGAALGRWLRLREHTVRLLIMCAVAAVIASNYNAPLGGALLVFEVIFVELNIGYLSLVLLSSVIATAIYRAFVGNVAKFPAPQYTLPSVSELWFFILLGVLCGLVGFLYIKVVKHSAELFARWSPMRLPLLKPAIGGALIGLTAYLVPLSFGRGTTGIDLALTGQLLPGMMLLLLVLKFFTVALTVGAWQTGGGYRAGLCIGALVGGTLGHTLHQLLPGVTSGSGPYALVGMGAFFAAVAQAPLTAIVMVSEMTKNVHLVLPLTVSAVVATGLSRLLSFETIYTARLIARGLDVANARRPDILRNLLVRDAMTPEPVTLAADLTIHEAYRSVADRPHELYPVLDHMGRLQGVVTAAELQDALSAGRLYDSVGQVASRPVVATTADTLQDALRHMSRHGVKRLPVVAAGDPYHVVGMLTLTDVVRAYTADLQRAAVAVAGRRAATAPVVSAPMAMAAGEISLYLCEDAAATPLTNPLGGLLRGRTAAEAPAPAPATTTAAVAKTPAAATATAGGRVNPAMAMAATEISLYLCDPPSLEPTLSWPEVLDPRRLLARLRGRTPAR
jgi:CIC family chloride channel protein